MSAFPERSANGSGKQSFPLDDGAPEPLAPKPANSTESDLLAQYGIAAVRLTSYEWGGYRYTNAHDAIAAAKREASK